MPLIDAADVEDTGQDICRVCRMESTPERPLFYPCLCTGSIKYIHQECLLQWLKYSKKEFCELCNHKYTFQPIYHPDMPTRLPVRDFVHGLGHNIVRAIRCWLIYTLVATAWLGVVPLTACRIYRAIFTGSISSLLTLPFDLFSLDNVPNDIVNGGFILSIFLCAFICLVWLSEQIAHGGPPNLLNLDGAPVNAAQQQQQQQQQVAQPAPNNIQNQLPVDNAANVEEPAVAPVINEPQPLGMAANNVHENDDNSDAASTSSGSDDLNPPLFTDSESDDDNIRANDNVQPDGNAGVQVDGGAGAAVGEAQAEDNNWFDWDRRGEELSWERLLGLDGSFAFIEHIFWVISLNTVFTLVFAFTPYHVGTMLARILHVKPYFVATHFDGLLSAVLGYICICVCLFTLHTCARIVRWSKIHRATATCYLIIKVFLLVLAEAGFFPLLCGWWLDICSLSLFSATLTQRRASFTQSPATSMFVHWLLGMLYVFYFASFVLVLRDVLRPGTLWFLRNLNDPDFNPIQEMLTLPVSRHIRRLVASVCLFMITIFLVIFLPVRLIRRTVPTLLPYNISPTSETPLAELSLELLLLQVILPALLEQSQARVAAKAAIRQWCLFIGKLLSLTSYLLGNIDVAPQVENNAAAAPPARPAQANNNNNNLAAEHQALLLAREPIVHAPYTKPTYFALRIIAMLLCLAISSVLCSIILFTVPVSVGRFVIRWVGGGESQVHELYTVSTGLYMCYLCLHGVMIAAKWLAQEWQALWRTVKSTLRVAAKCAVACIGLVFILPLLMGVAFQLVLLTPLRVNANQSPLYFPVQDWAMGVLHFKILCACVMMGPEWWMKRVFERLYADGIVELDIIYLYTQLVAPLAAALSTFIALPYVMSFGMAPYFGATEETCIALQRNSYLCIVFFTSLAAFLIWQVRLVSKLVMRIRDEKYLLGQRLVNYERHVVERQQQAQQLLAINNAPHEDGM